MSQKGMGLRKEGIYLTWPPTPPGQSRTSPAGPPPPPYSSLGPCGMWPGGPPQPLASSPEAVSPPDSPYNLNILLFFDLFLKLHFRLFY